MKCSNLSFLIDLICDWQQKHKQYFFVQLDIQANIQLTNIINELKKLILSEKETRRNQVLKENHQRSCLSKQLEDDGQRKLEVNYLVFKGTNANIANPFNKENPIK